MAPAPPAPTKITATSTWLHRRQLVAAVTSAALVCINAASAVQGDAPSVNVFHEKLGGVSCYRIPSIVQSKNGTLVAFAEARQGSCGT